jgi:flagellum-specific peptidoglycan hydrolase FlgJ
MTPEQLAALRRIAEAAAGAERATGCPAEISAAQCIVESAWLRVAPGNNCFGIKATDDHCQYCLTKEYLNGEWTNQKLAFATYPTLAACFAAHALLLQRGVYAPAWRRYQGDHDLDAYIRGIAEHYATDPGYAPKILQLAHGPHVYAAVAEARQRTADGVPAVSA